MYNMNEVMPLGGDYAPPNNYNLYVVSLIMSFTLVFYVLMLYRLSNIVYYIAHHHKLSNKRTRYGKPPFTLFIREREETFKII